MQRSSRSAQTKQESTSILGQVKRTQTELILSFYSDSCVTIPPVEAKSLQNAAYCSWKNFGVQLGSFLSDRQIMGCNYSTLYAIQTESEVHACLKASQVLLAVPCLGYLNLNSTVPEYALWNLGSLKPPKFLPPLFFFFCSLKCLGLLPGLPSFFCFSNAYNIVVSAQAKPSDIGLVWRNRWNRKDRDRVASTEDAMRVALRLRESERGSG